MSIILLTNFFYKEHKMHKIQLYKFGKNQNVNFGKEYVRSFYINTNDVKKSVKPYVKKGWQFKKSDMFDFPNTYTDVTGHDIYISPKGYRKLPRVNHQKRHDGLNSWDEYHTRNFTDAVETLEDLEELTPIYADII